MKHDVAHGIDAEVTNQIIRINYIALGLGHLALAHQQPWMTEHLLRQRQIQRHQHNRPVDRVETQNILTDQMDIRRPVVLKLFAMIAVAVVAQTGDVVGQRVDPDIHDMLRIKINRYAPGKGSAGNAKIL